MSHEQEQEREQTDSAYRLLMQVGRVHFHRVFELLEPLGIYPGQPHLLLSLERRDGQSQKELAGVLGVKPATIAVMLKRMEGSGMIVRRQAPEDQRVSQVYLTDQGREKSLQAKEVIQRLEAECFGNFSEEEHEQMRRLLARVRDNLQKTGGKHSPGNI